MPVAQFPFVGSAYKDTTLPVSAQETINFIPEIVETTGGTSVAVLKGAPGREVWAAVGTGPIRGAHNMLESFYVVSGDALYSVNSDGSSSNLGAVAGSGRVFMTSNSYQLLISNGTNLFVWDTEDSTLTQLTDPDAYPTSSIDFLDQYIIAVRDGTSQFYFSAIADAADYDALDFASAESNPDLLIKLIVNRRDIFMMGTRSIEVWNNTGDVLTPFQRIQGVVIERGIFARDSAVKLDNSIFWLADNKQVHMLVGYDPIRISTAAIEQDLDSYSNLASAFGYSWYDGSHAIYAITVPGGKTWCYDVSTKEWFRLTSYQLGYWRINNVTNVFGRNLFGDIEDGRIWRTDWTSFTEGDDPLVSERKTAYLRDGQAPLQMPTLELVLNTGLAELNGTLGEINPQIEMRYSDDFGRNWSNWKQRSMGLTGQYRKRARFKRLGRFRNRLFHVRVIDPTSRDIVAATIRAESAEFV